MKSIGGKLCLGFVVYKLCVMSTDWSILRQMFSIILAL